MGDEVLSCDEDTGLTAYKKVVRLFRNKTDTWCTVTVKREGQEECHEITSTPGHKYYLPDNTIIREQNERQEHASYIGLSNKWVSAIHLKYGDRVLLSDDTYGIIESVTTLHLSTPETTYNFEVEDYHTYFVGNGVCVHNTGCGEAMDVYNDFDIDSAYVKPKHLATTRGNGAKFVGGSKAEAEAVLKTAMRKGNIVQTANNGMTSIGNASYSYILNAGQVVGTHGQTHIYLVLAKGGGMLTSFPVNF